MPTQDSKIAQPAPGQLWRVLDDGRMAFWFDSHTVSDFTKCEQYFQLKNLLFAPQQLRVKGRPRSCISIGQWWSRVSELFYRRVAKWQLAPNVHEKPTMIDMMMIASHAWIDANMDAMEQDNPNAYEKFAIPVAYGQLGKYFPMVGEALSDTFIKRYQQAAHDLRNKAQVEEDDTKREALAAQARRLESRTALPLGALLMAMQYYNTYAEQDMENWHVIAAEEPFGYAGDIKVGETDKVVVFWQGKPDLVVYEKRTNVLAPIDQKTKDYIPYNIEVIWKPNNQMAGYIFALSKIAKDLGFDQAVVDRCILSVCGRLKPAEPRKKGASPKPRFVRVRPTWNQAELEEWAYGICRKAERMREVIETPDKAMRNEFMCHIYSGCEFRGIHSRPPGVRDLLIKSDLVKVDPWTPFDDEEGD